MGTATISDELDSLRYAISARSARVDPEVRWRIDLGLDVAGVYPKGPNPLPVGTWRAIAQSVVTNLAAIERLEVVGAKLATGTRLSVETAAALARSAIKPAKATIEEAWAILEGLTPADILAPWDLLGPGSPRNGAAEVLALLASQPRPHIQAEEAVRL